MFKKEKVKQNKVKNKDKEDKEDQTTSSKQNKVKKKDKEDQTTSS